MLPHFLQFDYELLEASLFASTMPTTVYSWSMTGFLGTIIIQIIKVYQRLQVLKKEVEVLCLAFGKLAILLVLAKEIIKKKNHSSISHFASDAKLYFILDSVV